MSENPEQAQALLQRILDVKQLLDSLHQDVLANVNDVSPQKPSASIAYVRSVFGLVEGAVSGMCAFLIEGQAVWGWTLTEPETKALWDAVPEPSVPRPDGGRATLVDRTKQVFKTGRRIFGEHCSTDFGGAGFQAFRAAILIRDRLMHPKTSADLDLPLHDLAFVDKGRDWFRACAKAFFEGAMDYGKRKVEDLSRRRRVERG